MKKKILPTHFYNIIPGLPKPLPFPKDKNGKLINGSKEFSLPINQELKNQEFSQKRKIEIPTGQVSQSFSISKANENLADTHAKVLDLVNEVYRNRRER